MNCVEEYLTNNKDLKLSIRTLVKRTGLKKKQVLYMCCNSNLIRRVNPLEVGSLRYKINTFTSI